MQLIETPDGYTVQVDPGDLGDVLARGVSAFAKAQGVTGEFRARGTLVTGEGTLFGAVVELRRVEMETSNG